MKVVLGSSYYGGIPVRHAESVRQIARSGEVLPLGVHGAPYPELARAHLVQEFFDNSDADVLVFLDANCAASPESILKMAERAQKLSGIVHQPVSKKGNALAFSAFSRAALAKLIEISPRLDTGFSFQAPAIFRRYEPSERYCTEDRSVLFRAWDAGIMLEVGEAPEWQSVPEYSERIVNAGNLEFPYAVCVACFGPRLPEQLRALATLEAMGVCILEVHNCPYIDIARSRLVSLAMTYGFRGVFFLDHDIVFNPGDVLALLKDSHAREVMIAGMYCMRAAARNSIGAIDAKENETLVFFEGGGLYPALYTGLGFAAIPRKFFDELDEKLPELNAGFEHRVQPYFCLDTSGTFYCGEDVSFCGRVHGLSVKSGGQPNSWEVTRTDALERIFIDTRIRIFHRGSYDYGLEDAGIITPRVSTLSVKIFKTREEACEFNANVDSSEARQQAFRREVELIKEQEHAAAPS